MRNRNEVPNILTPDRCVKWSVRQQEESGVNETTTETTPLCEEFIEDKSQPKILQFIKTDLEY